MSFHILCPAISIFILFEFPDYTLNNFNLLDFISGVKLFESNLKF